MISLINLFEGKKEYSGYTMGDVGGGFGKMYAGPIGYYIGKDLPDNPKKPIDEKKTSHRYGAMYNESLRAKKYIPAALLGSIVGGVGGATIVKALLKEEVGVKEEITEPDIKEEIKEYDPIKINNKLELDDNINRKLAILGGLSGAIVGGGIGGGIARGFGKYKAAKKLGYGIPGRLAAGSPIPGMLTTLATPKRLKERK